MTIKFSPLTKMFRVFQIVQQSNILNEHEVLAMNNYYCNCQNNVTRT